MPATLPAVCRFGGHEIERPEAEFQRTQEEAGVVVDLDLRASHRRALQDQLHAAPAVLVSGTQTHGPAEVEGNPGAVLRERHPRQVLNQERRLVGWDVPACGFCWGVRD